MLRPDGSLIRTETDLDLHPPGFGRAQVGTCDAEKSAAVEIAELFSWLHITDLSGKTSEELRAVLAQVIKAYPPEREVAPEEESLLEEIEESLESGPRAERLASWLQSYSALQPPSVGAVERTRRLLEEIASELDPEDLTSSRLQQFEALLELSEEEWEQEGEAAVDRLEAQVRVAWETYSSQRIGPDDVSAESVAGHQFLEEGFACWFDAFDLLREGELDQAWSQALEGNRFLAAVSIWSDSLRTTPSGDIGSA